MNMTKVKPSFYDKLTSQRHIGLDGEETYSTHKGKHGCIICRHAGKPDVRVLLYAEASGLLSMFNMDTRKLEQTFRHSGNTCAEEWHKSIELFSRED